MEAAAKDLDFIIAAKLRDEIAVLKGKLWYFFISLKFIKPIKFKKKHETNNYFYHPFYRVKYNCSN
jgi:hypothetical protein